MSSPSHRTAKSAPAVLTLTNPSLLYAPKFDKNSKIYFGNKAVFILSTGRTGTKYLADVLRQFTSITALHEPRPSYMLQAWSSAYLEGKVSDRYMQRIFAAKRHKIAKRAASSSLYIESNHFIDGFVEHIDEIVHEPTIIHIVRDPRDFITSMINRGNDRGLKLIFNKFAPYFAHAEPGFKRATMTPIEREACHWVGMNQHLSRFGASHDNYHFFRFEDIFTSDAKFTEVLRALQLSDEQIAVLDKDKADKNVSRLTGKKAQQSWKHWTNEECQTVEKLCGELMRDYGYGNEPKWLRRVS